MKKSLSFILAVALLSPFAGPALAQVPEGAPTPSIEESQFVWSAFAWCHSGFGLEIGARQGEIASALGVPVTSAQDGSDAAPRGDDESDTAFTCCSSTEALQSANGVTGVGPLFEHCQNAEYPLGSVVGLPTAYLEPMGIGGYAPPPGVIVWTEERVSPFHVNTSVSFVTGFCSTGLHGPQSMSEFIGTGASVSVGYTMPTGMEIQVHVGGCFIQQFSGR